MSTVLRAGAIVVHRKVFKQILPSFSAVKRFYSVSSRICALENRSYAISGKFAWTKRTFVQVKRKFYGFEEKNNVFLLMYLKFEFLGFNNYNQKRFVAAETGRRTYCQQEKERWTDLTYEQLNSLLESRDIVLIDVREPKEIEANGKIPESVNIPRKVLLIYSLINTF